MISVQELFHAVVLIICLGLVAWLLHWLIDYCAIPEPYNKGARVVLAVAGVLILIGILLSMAGYPVLRW